MADIDDNGDDENNETMGGAMDVDVDAVEWMARELVVGTTAGLATPV